MLPRMRPLTWLVAAFNALLLVAVAGGVLYSGPLWFLGNGALGVVWVASLRRRRACPQCGNPAPRTFLVCPVCRFDMIRPLPRRRPESTSES